MTDDRKPLPRQADFFIADLADPLIRDERGTMECPFFSLEKRKRLKPIEYTRGDISVTVSPSVKYGMATIWDADFLIWAASQINEAIERGEKPSPRLWVTPYNFLKQTRRVEGKASGHDYEKFEAMLDRLQSTSVKTNIPAAGEVVTSMWSWVESWTAHKDPVNGRIKGVEVWISQWIFDRIVGDRAVLSLHEDYFLLSGGLERILYRMARKHAGHNENGWWLAAKDIYEKSGSTREFRKFKSDLKEIVDRDCLPEYRTIWETAPGGERVKFTPRPGAFLRRRFERTIRRELT